MIFTNLATNPAETFTYDPNNHRKTTATTTTTHNPANQIQSNNDWLFQYDLNGNLIQRTGNSNKTRNITENYYYDEDNRLIAVKTLDGATLLRESKYTYDSLGRRTSVANRKATDTKWNLLYYLYDGDNEVGEYSAISSVNGSSFTTSPYFSSLFFNGTNIDEPVATWKFNDSANMSKVNSRYLFIPDSLGSITALSGAVSPGDNQSTIASYAYDSYGNLASICGGDIANKNLLRYTAREYTPLPDVAGYSHLPNSLQHNRGRTLDNSLGTFMQQDPKWDENLYWYTDDNPAEKVDPYGTDAYVVSYGGAIALQKGKIGYYGYAWDDLGNKYDVIVTQDVYVKKGVNVTTELNLGYAHLEGDNASIYDLIDAETTYGGIPIIISKKLKNIVKPVGPGISHGKLETEDGKKGTTVSVSFGVGGIAKNAKTKNTKNTDGFLSGTLRQIDRFVEKLKQENLPGYQP